MPSGPSPATAAACINGRDGCCRVGAQPFGKDSDEGAKTADVLTRGKGSGRERGAPFEIVPPGPRETALSTSHRLGDTIRRYAIAARWATRYAPSRKASCVNETCLSGLSKRPWIITNDEFVYRVGKDRLKIFADCDRRCVSAFAESFSAEYPALTAKGRVGNMKNFNRGKNEAPAIDMTRALPNFSKHMRTPSALNRCCQCREASEEDDDASFSRAHSEPRTM